MQIRRHLRLGSLPMLRMDDLTASLSPSRAPERHGPNLSAVLVNALCESGSVQGLEGI